MYNVSGINICQIMTIADNIDIYFQQHWIAILGDVGMDAASGIVPPYQDRVVKKPRILEILLFCLLTQAIIPKIPGRRVRMGLLSNQGS